MTDPLHTIQKWCSLMIPSDIQRISAIIFNTLSAESQLITCVSTAHLTNFKIAIWPPRETSAIDHGAGWTTIYGWTNLPAFVVLKHNQAVAHQQLVISAIFYQIVLDTSSSRQFCTRFTYQLWIWSRDRDHETRSREIVLLAIGSWVWWTLPLALY